MSVIRLRKLKRDRERPDFRDACREYRHRRRARKKAGTTKKVRAIFYAYMFNVWGNRCAYCRRSSAEAGRLQIDHFHPLARGGAHAEHNLVPACRKCNGNKGAKDPFVFLYDRKRRRRVQSEIDRRRAA